MTRWDDFDRAPLSEEEFSFVMADILNDSFNSTADGGMQKILATSFDVGPDGQVQFEVEPHYFGITHVQTGLKIVADQAVQNAMPLEFCDAIDAVGADPDSVIKDSLFWWLSDRWEVAGGPERYPTAVAFFRGANAGSPTWDLDKRRWLDI